LLIGEFNTGIASILIGMCVNSNHEMINDESKSILKSELVENKPYRLVHSYTLNEFKGLLCKFKNEGNDITLKEIIPNTYGLGLVREVGFKNSTVDELLSEVTKKFRYYAIVKSKDRKHNFFMTYNPNIKSLKTVKLKISQSITSVRCTTIQTGDNFEDIERLFECVDRKENEKGTIIIYDIELGES